MEYGKAVTDVMDLTVDQRGYKRAATTMSGSVDVNAQAPATGVENVAANAIQDGIYYTLQGQAIGKDFKHCQVVCTSAMV